MITLSFQRLAAQELRVSYAWYHARDPEVATRFLSSVDAVVARILEAPESHAVELKHIRWARVRRFPYRLIFEQTDPHRVLILAVAHSSRRSRYWRRRNE